MIQYHKIAAWELAKAHIVICIKLQAIGMDDNPDQMNKVAELDNLAVKFLNDMKQAGITK